LSIHANQHFCHKTAWLEKEQGKMPNLMAVAPVLLEAAA